MNMSLPVPAALMPNQQQLAVEAKRDHMLSQFEEYLLTKLRECDVIKDNQGVWLFNVNQTAYIIEGSCTDEFKRKTRRRVNNALSSSAITLVMVKSPTPGKGEMLDHKCSSYFGGKLYLTTPDSRGPGWSKGIDRQIKYFYLFHEMLDHKCSTCFGGKLYLTHPSGVFKLLGPKEPHNLAAKFCNFIYLSAPDQLD